MPKTYEPPCHGPHQEQHRTCPGCLKSELERQRKAVPPEIVAAVERQQHLTGLRAIGRF